MNALKTNSGTFGFTLALLGAASLAVGLFALYLAGHPVWATTLAAALAITLLAKGGDL